ncbi:MAG: hypothetical protein HYT34_02585 [Candidatus Ryanbacteria bacterium]|nr:hypothetical protein [Candidatus Ryanbacteria bacterium]
MYKGEVRMTDIEELEALKRRIHDLHESTNKLRGDPNGLGVAESREFSDHLRDLIADADEALGEELANEAVGLVDKMNRLMMPASGVSLR